MEVIGNYIRVGRATKRMTQAELARRLGLNQPVVSAYERGVSIPPGDVLCRIITTLDLDCQRLICQVSETCMNEKLTDSPVQ